MKDDLQDQQEQFENDGGGGGDFPVGPGEVCFHCYLYYSACFVAGKGNMRFDVSGGQ